MNLVQRHQAILHRIHQEKNITIMRLSNDLNVSSVTIRKDIRLLEAKKLIFRRNGRAFANFEHIQKPDSSAWIQSLNKKKIGDAAVAQLNENDSVALASGELLQHFARQIPDELPLTVVTSSLETAVELLRCPRVEVIQLAGSLRKGSASVVGAYAEQGLRDLYFNVLFLEVEGIDFQHGLTVANAAEAHLNKRMIGLSQKVVVLVDSSKFNQISFSRICAIESIDHIITDRGVNPKIIEETKALGIGITVV
jgi:DeoR family transcriptional regulator of aga operon